VLHRLAPLLLLTVLGLVFFAALVLHPTQVLYSDYSDLLAEHLPARHFLARSWHETGELPRWCPYVFAGSPFLHDFQIEVYYPPHALLLYLPENLLGAGLSWLVFFHVLLAGFFTYALAREEGLERTPALIAATGYMFAGKWLLHLLAAGHYVVLGLAWLPLVLLFLEQALRRRSFLRATAAGGVFGLLVLSTQPQWTLYAGIFIALWTLGTALETAGYLGGQGLCSRRQTAAALGRWLGFGAWVALVGAALAAVQLLPTLEAAQWSSRNLGVGPGSVFECGLRSLLCLVGPALNNDSPVLAWEDRGGLGLLWLVAAALAPLLCRGRVRYQAGVCLALALFAFGGAIVVQGLPGFRLFGRPARMLLVITLPVALLAGATTQALLAGLTSEQSQRGRRLFLRILVAAVILVGGLALRLMLTGKMLSFHVYWLSLLATIPAAFILLRPGRGIRGRGAVVWGSLLVIDLWALAWPLVAVRPESAIYRRSACIDYVVRHQHKHDRLLDRDAGDWGGTPLGPGAPLALLEQIEPLRGYNPLDVLRYKEYLHLAGGNSEPLRPFSNTLTYPVMRSFPVKNKKLLDLLGVRFLLQPAEDKAPAGWQPRLLDAAPATYDFCAGGVPALPPYRVYENDPRAVFPRAFVVPRAQPLPERSHVLATMAATDFRQVVLLEDFTPKSPSPAPRGGFRAAFLSTYQPNRVVIDLEAGPAGFLVLTDVWYPGWQCIVDGRSVPIHRGNFLFRAVALPAGARQVVFSFAPASHAWGKAISLGALAALLGCGLLALGIGWMRQRRGAHKSERHAKVVLTLRVRAVSSRGA
jgi:hypothetical protein